METVLVTDPIEKLRVMTAKKVTIAPPSICLICGAIGTIHVHMHLYGNTKPGTTKITYPFAILNCTV